MAGGHQNSKLMLFADDTVLFPSEEFFFFELLVGFVVKCEAATTGVPQSAGEFYFPPEEQCVAPSRL